MTDQKYPSDLTDEEWDHRSAGSDDVSVSRAAQRYALCGRDPRLGHH